MIVLLACFISVEALFWHLDFSQPYVNPFTTDANGDGVPDFSCRSSNCYFNSSFIQSGAWVMNQVRGEPVNTVCFALNVVCFCQLARRSWEKSVSVPPAVRTVSTLRLCKDFKGTKKKSAAALVYDNSASAFTINTTVQLSAAASCKNLCV
jgi:hypothetical protein